MKDRRPIVCYHITSPSGLGECVSEKQLNEGHYGLYCCKSPTECPIYQNRESLLDLTPDLRRDQK